MDESIQISAEKQRNEQKKKKALKVGVKNPHSISAFLMASCTDLDIDTKQFDKL